MNEQEIKKMVDMLEDMNIPGEKIDEFVSSLPKTIEEEEKTKRDLEKIGIHIATLKDSLSNEKDWRKRASIAARIISLGFDE